MFLLHLISNIKQKKNHSYNSFFSPNKVPRFSLIKNSCCVWTKAELLQEGIFFLLQLFARDVLVMKKLEIEETKATWYSTFKTDIIKVGIVFSISNLFIKESSLANKCMSFTYSNSAIRYLVLSTFVFRIRLIFEYSNLNSTLGRSKQFKTCLKLK